LSARLTPRLRAAPAAAVTPAQTGLVQSKCACGGSPATAGGCGECGRTKRLALQRSSAERAGPSESRFGHNFARLQAPARRPPEAQTKLSASGPGGPNEEVTRAPATPVSGEPQPSASSQTPPLATPEAAGEAAVASGAAAETALADETLPAGLVTEDEARELAPGQMRKSEFLNELHRSVCAAADAELAAVGRSAVGCPYIEQWIGYYRTQASQHIERAIRKYARGAGGVATARDYIPLVSERVRQGVSVWALTGQITGVPEGLAGQTPEAARPGASEGLATGASGDASGAMRGGEEGSGEARRLSFKSRDGGAGDAHPEAIQSRLGAGSPLDSGVRSRMESAFAYDFSRVRVHADSGAAGLSDGLNARAFTVGSDIAFGAGEYQPGTLVGDALLAHELAHVVQQGGAASPQVLSPKGGAEYGALEADADESAVGAVASLWAGAKEGIGHLSRHVMPRLKSGLGLQRCNKKSETEPKTKSKCKVKSGPTYTPSGTLTPTLSGGLRRTSFDLAAEFEHDPSNGFDASCCEVRQFILWTADPPPNHAGWKPESDYSANTWYEDRDGVGKRYGHRTGTHSECIGINHYEDKAATKDCAQGQVYKGQDTPGGASSRTGQWQFRLKVIDTCDGAKDVGTTASVIVQW